MRFRAARCADRDGLLELWLRRVRVTRTCLTENEGQLHRALDFLEPAYQRRGGRRQVVDHARALAAERTLELNVPIESGRRFHVTCGSVVRGRSSDTMNHAGRASG